MKFCLSEVRKNSCLIYIVLSLCLFSGSAYSAAGQHFLAPGQQLQPGQSLRSMDGSKKMQFQTDGNLVIQEVSSGTVIWHSHTYGRVPGRVTMQHDGNFVMYEYGQPIWNTGTYDMTSQNVTLFLFNSGVAVLQTQAKEYVWGSDGNYRICERLVPDSSEHMPTVNATITATTNSRLMPQPHLKCKVDTLVRPNDNVAIHVAKGEWRYVTINGQNQEGWVWKGVLSNDLDLQTPEMIDVAIKDITHNKVSFTFFGQDNTDVAKYRLYLDGREMGDVSGSVTQKTFQIEPNTWTTVAARVIDSAGNISDYKSDARWSSPTPVTIPTQTRPVGSTTTQPRPTIPSWPVGSTTTQPRPTISSRDGDPSETPSEDPRTWEEGNYTLKTFGNSLLEGLGRAGDGVVKTGEILGNSTKESVSRVPGSLGRSARDQAMGPVYTGQNAYYCAVNPSWAQCKYTGLTALVTIAARGRGPKLSGGSAAKSGSDASTVGIVAVPNSASLSTNALKLEKQLASEGQLGQLTSGGGTVISQPAKQANRIAEATGRNSADIQKVSSDARIARDGTRIETHSFRDASTNELIEPKTIIGR